MTIVDLGVGGHSEGMDQVFAVLVAHICQRQQKYIQAELLNAYYGTRYKKNKKKQYALQSMNPDK